MDLWGYASDIAPYYMASLFSSTLQLTTTHLVFEAVQWIIALAWHHCALLESSCVNCKLYSSAMCTTIVSSAILCARTMKLEVASYGEKLSYVHNATANKHSGTKAGAFLRLRVFIFRARKQKKEIGGWMEMLSTVTWSGQPIFRNGALESWWLSAYADCCWLRKFKLIFPLLHRSWKYSASGNFSQHGIESLSGFFLLPSGRIDCYFFMRRARGPRTRRVFANISFLTERVFVVTARYVCFGLVCTNF